MKTSLCFAALLHSSAFLAGCQSPTTIVNAAPQQITLGTVQKSIHKGMTQPEVIAELGAPTMVTRDKAGIEVWVYDKASTIATTSNVSGYGTLILTGASGHQSASVVTQKTLTLILKFKDAELSEYSYRYSSF